MSIRFRRCSYFIFSSILFFTSCRFPDEISDIFQVVVLRFAGIGHLELVENCASETESAQLPFLLKVLSVRKPLSIQLHPDRILAGLLHSKKPEMYPDANHKPELVIALTKFPILCGFRVFDEVQNFFKIIPALGDLVEGTAESSPDYFKILLRASNDRIKFAIDKISEYFARNPGFAKIKHYFEYLQSECAYDVGVLMVFVIQIHELEPLEAMYVPAMVPHAYLGGKDGCEAIEIMANSDNVIRVGLTPKAKDLETVLSWQNYNKEPMQKFPTYRFSQGLVVYEMVGVCDFALRRYEFSQSGAVLNTQSASIVIVAKGSVVLGLPNHEQKCKAGEAFLVEPDTNVHILPSNDDKRAEYLVFQAYSLVKNVEGY